MEKRKFSLRGGTLQWIWASYSEGLTRKCLHFHMEQDEFSFGAATTSFTHMTSLVVLFWEGDPPECNILLKQWESFLGGQCSFRLDVPGPVTSTAIEYATHYLAESLSWYSLERPKHSWTPMSAHNRFMAARSSSENGSVSSIRWMTSKTIFASVWNSKYDTQ